MLNFISAKKYPGIVVGILGVLFVSGGLFFIAGGYTHAEMSGTQVGRNRSGNMREQTVHVPYVSVELKTTPVHIQAGRPATILFSVKDQEGKPVQNLVVHHDRIMHVVITSRDFRVFAHIHPEDLGPITPDMKKTARFPVKFNFPKAGSYIIGVDFAAGERLISGHFLVEVSGAPHLGILQKDFSRKKRFGGYEVTLTSLPETIRAGEEVTLNYNFKKQNKPVTDLEPYLSAPMHVAIISADLKYFMHEHGELHGISHSNYKNGMHMAMPGRFGPQITVHAVFPARGVYQIFGQVEHNGKVILTSFMVKVE